MRVVRYERHGGPEVLQVRQIDEPTPGPGQVAISTEAIAGSFVDTTMRSGISAYGPGRLPGSPHGEVVGRVRAVGDGVDPALIGLRVAALVETDAYADVVLAGADWATIVPDGISAEDGSALAMAAPCALIALVQGGFRPGDSVLIHAAAGSIGHLTVQLARRLGAGTVIGTVGSAAKKDFVRGLGADAVASIGDDDWDDQVREFAPEGVDLVIDSIGGEVTSRSIALTGTFGRTVVFGAAGGSLPDIPAYTVMGGMRTVTGFGFRQYRDAQPDEARRQLAPIIGMLATGELRVEVAAVVSLDEPAKAHEFLEDRSRLGRVMITP